ncbi:hypothetical protein [Bowmanella sp. JS7-9]|uniref:Uncharacterized protein n=1 Tax=Pseudobowmanella zhangzhouensis TaxID=1537679 RepID=A0ABW1XQP1_9ALTE|nr:hypothetical protein [Bowmanella sp. JS7-9]TBX21909.1 hypothetical protein TK45_10475 [Bowmanella sp. JS7-9]
MKMKPEHYAVLEKEINATLDRHGRQALIREYEHGQFARADKVKDLQMRFCFDLAYGAGLTRFICDTLFQYLDSSHVYTALKRICPTVERKY